MTINFWAREQVFTTVMNPRSAVNRKSQYRRTHVGMGASIGANATIVCGSPIGGYAFIGAGTVVSREMPFYTWIVGNTGRQIGWMSRSGQRYLSMKLFVLNAQKLEEYLWDERWWVLRVRYCRLARFLYEVFDLLSANYWDLKELSVCAPIIDRDGSFDLMRSWVTFSEGCRYHWRKPGLKLPISIS